MRRPTLRTGLPAIVLIVVGVAAGPAWGLSNDNARGPRLVYVGGDAGITAVDLRAHNPVFNVPNAVAAPRWSQLWATSSDGIATELRTIDARTGRALGVHRLSAGWSVRTVSHDGRTAALIQTASSAGPYQPVARAHTTILVATTHRRAPRTLDLPGNYEPEAFTTDGTGLVVLQYTPPTAPQRYQVRLLELSSGRVHDLQNRAGGKQEIMRGTAYAQALSPDGRRLSTLYLREPADVTQPPRAFVHVLDLQGKWAECVDLPARFATGAPSALAASPDGQRLFVAVPDIGAIAAVDMATLRVERTRSLPQYLWTPGPASASADTHGRLYIAHGNDVSVVDRDLHLLRRLELGDQLLGITANGDGSRLLLAVSAGLTVVESRRGTLLDTVGISGITSTSYLAPAVRPIHPGNGSFPEKQ